MFQGYALSLPCSVCLANVRHRPPFTIQRICELILHPRAHYTSLPKYLRALNRATSVSSDRSAFTEDDSLDFSYASTSATTLDSSAPVLLSSAIGSSSGPIQVRPSRELPLPPQS